MSRQANRLLAFGPAVSAGLMFSCLLTAPAQDPLKLLPSNYKLAFENKEVAVIRAHYGPHEKIPVHDHTSFSTVFVYLSDSGPVRIDHQEEGEPPSSITRPPTVKGAYRVAAGIKERHSIENLGDLSSDFLRVELKNVSFDLKEPFRGKAPSSTTAALDTVEFNNSALEIERIVCPAGPACEVKASPSPSLLIAFTPVALGSGAEKKQSLDAGAVDWLPASQATSIAVSADSPAHVLRILLPEAAPR